MKAGVIKFALGHSSTDKAVQTSLRRHATRVLVASQLAPELDAFVVLGSKIERALVVRLSYVLVAVSAFLVQGGV